MAAQLTLINARDERFDRLWIAQRDEFFPGSGLSVDEHRGIRRSDFGNTREYCLQGRRGSDDLLEHRRFIDFFSKRDILFPDVLFRKLPLMDVDGCRVPSNDVPVLILQRDEACKKPTVLTVFSECPILRLIRDSERHRVPALFPQPFPILRMNDSLAAIPQ